MIHPAIPREPAAFPAAGFSFLSMRLFRLTVTFSLALGSAAISCALPPADPGTAILINDTFTGGLNADTAAYPRWQTGATSLTCSSPDDNLAIVGHARSDGRGDNLTGRPFPETALGVGDELILNYNFLSDNNTPGTIYRVGLYQLTPAAPTDGSLKNAPVGKAGYYSFYNHNAVAGGNAAVLRREVIQPSQTTIHGAAPNTQLTSIPVAQRIGTTPCSVVFSIMNLGDGVTKITSTLYAGADGSGPVLYSLSQKDTSGLTTFNSIFFLTPVGTTVVYDNILLVHTTPVQ